MMISSVLSLDLVLAHSHCIPVELRAIIHHYLQQTLDDSNILSAVNLWITNPQEAMTLYGPITHWDTSIVTDMSRLFMIKKNFNENISCWDVSQVTNMSFMFFSAVTFNQPLQSWNVANVKLCYYV
jgi:surface protein